MSVLKTKGYSADSRGPIISDEESGEKGESSSGELSSTGSFFSLSTFATFTTITVSTGGILCAGLSCSVAFKESSIFCVTWVLALSCGALATWSGSLLEIGCSGVTTFTWCARVAWLVFATAGIISFYFDLGCSVALCQALALAFVFILEESLVATDFALLCLAGGNHHQESSNSLVHCNC